MADNETTADIIAWLRRPIEGENAYLTLWRDEIAARIEVALRRERGDAAKLREALEKCADWGEQIDHQLGSSDETVYTFRGERCLAHNISECARAALAAPATAEKSSAVGDAAKLREALKRIVAASIVAKNANAPEWILQRMADIFAMATTALSASPRNCDVGTAEEQDERFHRFCVKHHTGSCAGCHNPVGDYTVANGVRECALVWAQMPYEEGGAK